MSLKKTALRFGLPALLLLGIGGSILIGRSGPDTQYTTFTVRQGPLDIKVLEGGDVEAIESQEVKSQVKGWEGVKILSIVEEGTYITEEDVKNKKVLVELDSSELNEKLTTSEIAFKGTEASLTEALKGYEIQLNKSESDIYAAELETKFAKMEMEKYLGVDVTKEVLSVIGDEVVEIKNVEAPLQVAKPAKPGPMVDVGDEIETPAETITPEEIVLPPVTLEDLQLGHPDINFSAFVKAERLGNGGANQELSNLTSDAALSKEDLAKAETDLEGKIRLHEGKHITRQELRTSEIAVEKQKAGRDAKEKALEIFINYEFPKQAEKLMSDFIQARRTQARTEQQALSEIAQANAKMASAKARYQIEEKRIREYQEQIGACVMVAERAGLVVYGGSGQNYWNSEPIKEGATIRERQSIITIPDMSTMAVKVDVHESDIKNVKVGQDVRVRVESFADKTLKGTVTKVAVLPDSENRWMNPDLKVYETTVAIEGIHEWLKPGMSAETEIMIDRLTDAIYIPLQSVVPQKGKLVCFVIENGEPVAREIETAAVTIEYIVVTSGLSEGELVLIRPPEGSRDDDEKEDDATEESSDKATTEEKVVEETKDATPTDSTTAAPESTDPKATPQPDKPEAKAVDSD